MIKLPRISWEEVYERWNLYAACSPVILNDPIRLKELNVNSDEEGTFIYGYDWLSLDEYRDRKNLIETNLYNFLYFTKPTNKGTIHTLRMLMDSESDEERAAIWIYAFAKELYEAGCGKINKFTFQLCNACLKFLSGKFYLWHHAMRRLVPEIFINRDIYLETEFSSIDAIIELARINAALVIHEYVPVLYSSLPCGEHKEDYTLHF